MTLICMSAVSHQCTAENEIYSYWFVVNSLYYDQEIVQYMSYEEVGITFIT